MENLKQIKLIKYVDEISLKRVRVLRVKGQHLHHLVGKIFNVYAVVRDHEDQIKVFFRGQDQTLYSLDIECVQNATLKLIK